MFFGIDEQLNPFPDAQIHPQQRAPMSFTSQTHQIRQLREYRHEANRLGEYIEYVGASDANSPPSAQGTTYAKTTPHPQAYRLVKVPTYTLQPADTEQFPPHELDATRHLSHQWVIFRDKCRNMIAQGVATVDEVLGTTSHFLPVDQGGLADGDTSQFGADDVEVDLAMLFQPPTLESAVTIFGWCAAFVAKGERIRTLPLGLRMATVYLAVLMLRVRLKETLSLRTPRTSQLLY